MYTEYNHFVTTVRRRNLWCTKVLLARHKVMYNNESSSSTDLRCRWQNDKHDQQWWDETETDELHSSTQTDIERYRHHVPKKRNPQRHSTIPNICRCTTLWNKNVLTADNLCWHDSAVSTDYQLVNYILIPRCLVQRWPLYRQESLAR